MTDEHDRGPGPASDGGNGTSGIPAWEPGSPVEAGFGPAWSASWARASADELDYWLAFAQAACDAADEVALRYFKRDVAVMTKPDRSPVTEADQLIERLVRERIRQAFPDHGIVGEEYGREGGSARRWFVDPIDGTKNFIRGIPLFGTLLALEVDGEIQVGVMSAPAFRERWYARRGGGAWAVGAAGNEGPRAVHVSRVASLPDAQILYGGYIEVESTGRAPGFHDLIASAWRERGFSDFWGYALVSEGAAEAMIEVDLSEWDLAAPLVIVEESGGRMTDFDALRRIDTGTLLASNGLLHDTVLERLRGGG